MTNQEFVDSPLTIYPELELTENEPIVIIPKRTKEVQMVDKSTGEVREVPLILVEYQESLHTLFIRGALKELWDIFEFVKDKPVEITFTGKIPLKSGKTYNTFKIRYTKDVVEKIDEFIQKNQ